MKRPEKAVRDARRRVFDAMDFDEVHSNPGIFTGKPRLPFGFRMARSGMRADVRVYPFNSRCIQFQGSAGK